MAALPSYKTHRLTAGSQVVEETPPGLTPQVPVIVDLLAALGLARVGCPGFEADDVMATLAERAAAEGDGPVEVVTGDRDLFQLVDDARGVSVLYVGRGVRNLEVVDERWLERKYGVRGGPAYADLATLRGDPSDGLPGVPGVGEKTAAGLLSKFPDLVAVRAAAAASDPAIAPGLAAKIRARRGLPELGRRRGPGRPRRSGPGRRRRAARPSRPTYRPWPSWPTAGASGPASTGSSPRSSPDSRCSRPRLCSRPAG